MYHNMIISNERPYHKGFKSIFIIFKYSIPKLLTIKVKVVSEIMGGGGGC